MNLKFITLIALIGAASNVLNAEIDLEMDYEMTIPEDVQKELDALQKNEALKQKTEAPATAKSEAAASVKSEENGFITNEPQDLTIEDLNKFEIED